MWFLVGISRVVLSSSIFLRGLLVDALPSRSASHPFLWPTSVTPSLRLHLNLFPFSECSNLYCDTGKIRRGSSLRISSDMVLLPLVWGHRTKMREFRDRVISYLGETSWSAGCSVGPRGASDVSDEKPQRKSPEPVSFIKSDKLFLTIALFFIVLQCCHLEQCPLCSGIPNKWWMNQTTCFVKKNQKKNIYTCLMHLGAQMCR